MTIRSHHATQNSLPTLVEIDPRKEKRHLRKCGYDACYDAYIRGEYDAYSKRGKRNPYPRGKRHDCYEQGFGLSDPLGDWHGHNA